MICRRLPTIAFLDVHDDLFAGRTGVCHRQPRNENPLVVIVPVAVFAATRELSRTSRHGIACESLG